MATPCVAAFTLSAPCVELCCTSVPGHAGRRGIERRATRLEIERPETASARGALVGIYIFGSAGRHRLRKKVRALHALTGVRRSKTASVDEDFSGVSVVESTDGRGKCLIVERDLQPGEMVIEEEPLFVCAPGWHNRRIILKLRKLPPSTREAMLTLSSVDGTIDDQDEDDGAGGRLLGVLRANGIGLPRGGRSVCILACRANHSCQPNAALLADNYGSVAVVAIRPLKAGSEVLVSYLGENELVQPTRVRRRELQRGAWKFVCECDRCTKPDESQGVRCAKCNEGVLYPMDELDSNMHNLLTACSNCGDNSFSAEEFATLTGQWERMAENLHTKGSYLRDALGSSNTQVGNRAVVPFPGRNWVLARVAQQTAEEYLANNQATKAAAAARQVVAYIRHVRPGSISVMAAEATALRAQAIGKAAEGLAQAGHASRARRASRLANRLNVLAFRESLPLSGEEHDSVVELLRQLESADDDDDRGTIGTGSDSADEGSCAKNDNRRHRWAAMDALFEESTAAKRKHRK